MSATQDNPAHLAPKWHQPKTRAAARAFLVDAVAKYGGRGLGYGVIADAPFGEALYPIEEHADDDVEYDALLAAHIGPLYQELTGKRYKSDAPDAIRVREWVEAHVPGEASTLQHGEDEEGMARTSLRGVLFPEQFLALSNVEETSWGNDTADSIAFEVDSEPFRMFVEFPHPSDREDDGYMRYMIWSGDATSSEDEVIFETDSAAEAREWAEAAAKGEIIEQE